MQVLTLHNETIVIIHAKNNSLEVLRTSLIMVVWNNNQLNYEQQITEGEGREGL